MRMTPKFAAFGTFIACFICVLVVLSVWLTGGFQEAQAQGGTGADPNIIGIDVKIDDDGDTTPDNTQSTLGTIDTCIEVATDDVFQVDVFLDDVPTGQDFSSQDFYLSFDNTKLTAVSQDHAAGTILLGVTNGGLYNASSTGASYFHSTVMDTGVPPAAYAEQPGDLGVLGRYTFQATASGLTSLNLSNSAIVLGNSSGTDWFATDIDQVWDANYTTQYGLVAVDTDCPHESICNDGIDNDQDGATDCDDSDCATDPVCLPESICNDGIDNDQDGATDCDDSDCATDPVCLPESICNDGIDNDQDGATDCDDSDCATDPVCLPGPGLVDYAITKIKPQHLVFRNPRFFRLAIYHVKVENVGAVADGPARIHLSIEAENAGCPEPWVFPGDGYLLTLDPGKKKNLKFMVVFWPCEGTSPPVDYRVMGIVSAPGDDNPANDSIDATVNVGPRRCQWWCWWWCGLW
jgi:hypothetical protein